MVFNEEPDKNIINVLFAVDFTLKFNVFTFVFLSSFRHISLYRLKHINNGNILTISDPVSKQPNKA